mgnify:CR=1 FL=1
MTSASNSATIFYLVTAGGEETFEIDRATSVQSSWLVEIEGWDGTPTLSETITGSETSATVQALSTASAPAGAAISYHTKSNGYEGVSARDGGFAQTQLAYEPHSEGAWVENSAGAVSTEVTWGGTMAPSPSPSWPK